jgi:phosphopantetheinyl transferase
LPLFFQHHINASTRLAIWKIEENEAFFQVPLQREITHPHKRLQHMAGRFLLKYLFPQFPVDQILIADTRKPYLENASYQFSISHCGDYAAVIISESMRVGIDVEIPAPKVLRVQHKFLHPDEQAMLSRWGTSHQTEWTTLIWSAKEAMFKWWGRGDVDFSEVLRLNGQCPEESGILEARFIKPPDDHTFTMEYRFFSSLVLTWVATINA